MNTKKSILIVIALILMSVGAYAQTIPAAVTQAFNSKFPSAANVKWDKENKNDYEASFDMNGITYSANFTATGDWLETETGTSFDQLPQTVQDAFRKGHKTNKVKAAAIIETSQGVTKYEVEYKNGKKTSEFLYDDKGNVVK